MENQEKILQYEPLDQTIIHPESYDLAKKSVSICLKHFFDWLWYIGMPDVFTFDFMVSFTAMLLQLDLSKVVPLVTPRTKK